MKVLCINEYIPDQEIPEHQRHLVDESKIIQLPAIKVGDYYTIIDTGTYKEMVFYRLAERVDETGAFKWWYPSSCFGIPSQIDETEISKNIYISNEPTNSTAY